MLSTSALLRTKEIFFSVSWVVFSACSLLFIVLIYSVSLLLSVQMKNMTTDPKKEEEEVEKDPVAKKEDYICLLKQLVYILYRGQKFFCCFVDIIPTAAQCKFTLHSRESQILCFNQYQINYHQISDICRIEDLNIHTIHRSHRSHRIHKMGRRYPSCKEGSGTITTTIT